MYKFLLFVGLGFAVAGSSSCNRKSGCPAMESQVDYNKMLSEKPQKKKSGLLPDDGKKYFKKNTRSPKK